MSKRLSILVPDSHTPRTPERKRGILEATVTQVLKTGGMLVRATNGKVYIVDEHGVAVSEVVK